MDGIWLGLLVIGLAVAGATGRVESVTEAIMASSQTAVETVIGFLGITSLWMGIMKIAEEAGLVRSLARLLEPLMRRLFPSIPPGDPAMGAVVMSVSANLLGVGPAATPLGLKAMQELQRINRHKHCASDAMVTFLAITTSGITFIPASVIAVRAAAGSADPAEVVGPTLVASAVATAAGLIADRLLRRWAPVPPAALPPSTLSPPGGSPGGQPPADADPPPPTGGEPRSAWAAPGTATWGGSSTRPAAAGAPRGSVAWGQRAPPAGRIARSPDGRWRRCFGTSSRAFPSGPSP